MGKTHKVDEVELANQQAARDLTTEEILKLNSDDGPEAEPEEKDDQQAEDSDRELTKEKYPDDEE